MRYKREVSIDGSAVHLMPTEFRLLCTFARYPNRVLTCAVLIKEVWEAEFSEDYVHSLRVYVGNLRRKVCARVATARQMQTEVTIGYRFQTE